MKNKTCKKCGKEKPLSAFYKSGKYYNSYCKKCSKEVHRNYVKANKEQIDNYNKNKKNEWKHNCPWKFTLYAITQRCNDKNATNYKYYGGRGIKCLITEEELKELWFRDKAYEMEMPSIDRKDNDGNYMFENCRYIEMSRNIGKRNIENAKK